MELLFTVSKTGSDPLSGWRFYSDNTWDYYDGRGGGYIIARGNWKVEYGEVFASEHVSSSFSCCRQEIQDAYREWHYPKVLSDIMMSDD